MKRTSLRVLVVPAALLLGLLAASFARAQEAKGADKALTITGTMDIDFKTRTDLDTDGTYVEGSPKLGAKDTYTFKLIVGETTEYTGKITRQGDLFTKIIKSQKQKAALGFDVNLVVHNPSNPDEKKNVGKWVGTLPINTQTGVYDIAGGAKGESPLRIAIDAAGSQQAFIDKFGGKLVGKSKKDEGLASYTYKRLVGTKTVEIKVEKVDPMRFEDVELAKGPSPNYPHTMVNGRLDYDYETGNWLTDGLKFKYNLNGKDVEDVVTGSIKWVEDENRKFNGKGQYEFNLRFNEGKNKPATTEAAAFDKLSDEDAFFVVDDTIPCLTGKITYVDQFISGTDSPAKSKITYSLTANKLTKTQMVNFFKLWMLGVGPTNDE